MEGVREGGYTPANAVRACAASCKRRRNTEHHWELPAASELKSCSAVLLGFKDVVCWLIPDRLV